MNTRNPDFEKLIDSISARVRERLQDTARQSSSARHAVQFYQRGMHWMRLERSSSTCRNTCYSAKWCKSSGCSARYWTRG